MEQTIPLPTPWNRGILIAFRFFFVYFVLYLFPFPLHVLPFTGIIIQPLSQFSSNIVEGVGNILGIPVSIVNGGSGDAAFYYVQFFLFLFYAAVITLAWSVLDRRRFNYRALLYGFMVCLRYYLAIVMLDYGFAKVFKTQFGFPSTERLIQPLVSHLLWVCFGLSWDTRQLITYLPDSVR